MFKPNRSIHKVLVSLCTCHAEQFPPSHGQTHPEKGKHKSLHFLLFSLDFENIHYYNDSSIVRTSLSDLISLLYSEIA